MLNRRICVQFLDRAYAGRASAWLEPTWVNIGAGEFHGKTFEIRLALAPKLVAGYVVRSFYRRQLQDATQSHDLAGHSACAKL